MRREMVHDTMWRKLLNALPHAYNMAEEDWQRRHRLLLWVLGVHVPALVALGLALGYAPRTLVFVVDHAARRGDARVPAARSPARGLR